MGTKKLVSRGRKLAVCGAVAALAVAGCGGGGSDDGAEAIRVAVTSGADAGDVVAVTAPIEFGEEFDLEADKSGIKRFDSHATAAQVMLSGRADAVAGSFAGSLALIEKNDQVKVFCPMQIATTEMLVGTGPTDSIESLMSKDSTLAIDSPGGAADSFLNTLLQVKDAGFTVSDVPNKLILEDGGQRVTAVQTGEATASIVDAVELEILKEALGPDKIKVISLLARDLGESAVYQVFSASTSWLEDNQDLAARWCASAIIAGRAASEDFDTLQRIVNKYVEPDPSTEELRAMFDLAQEYVIWPTETLITEEQFDANMRSAVASGVLEGELSYDAVMDVAVMEAAAKLVEESGQ